MAQLWGGRFTKKTDKLVYNFNASISFDKKFYRQDMEGSMAHVKMLAAVGILTEKERDDILRGIEGILADVESGALDISDEYEESTALWRQRSSTVSGTPAKNCTPAEAVTIRWLSI